MMTTLEIIILLSILRLKEKKEKTIELPEEIDFFEGLYEYLSDNFENIEEKYDLSYTKKYIKKYGEEEWEDENYLDQDDIIFWFEEQFLENDFDVLFFLEETLPEISSK